MFLLEYQDQECVLEVFVWLETVLGQDAFKKLFPVILTDGGSEFSAREEMEEFCDGSNIKIYSCASIKNFLSFREYETFSVK